MRTVVVQLAVSQSRKTSCRSDIRAVVDRVASKVFRTWRRGNRLLTENATSTASVPGVRSLHTSSHTAPCAVPCHRGERGLRLHIRSFDSQVLSRQGNGALESRAGVVLFPCSLSWAAASTLFAHGKTHEDSSRRCCLREDLQISCDLQSLLVPRFGGTAVFEDSRFP